ncbi:insulinase family protein [Pseudomonas sp. N3-W]|uniref:M16 family metallopeptidase n=1 Tax=Pseudomonas sp. N3-W TaxID=2975049 RepID=UPI00217DE47D|nr:pitrilysin family protein [Pseudomonas sp. N3-W]UWF49023.1 insulinase family protein [Pseudomonas sp. N3-W]
MRKPTVMTLWLWLGALQGGPAIADVEPRQSGLAPHTRLQSLAELDEQPAASRDLKIHGWKSPSGGKVLFIRTTQLPMFDLHVSFAAGSTQDGAYPGLAAATLSLLNEGVPGKDLTAILETFDDVGARLGMSIRHDRAAMSLRSLTAIEKRDPALYLFGQILGKPLLTEQALVHVKNELTDLLKSRQQNAALQALNTHLLGVHPYAQFVYGTEKGVAALSRERVQTFHRQAYSAANAQITLVGDLTLEQAQAISLQVLDALPPGSRMPPVAPVARRQGNGTSQHIEGAGSQMQILLGQPGLIRAHPDYIALRVGHMIFGGENSSSRLMTELREQRGLTYTAQLNTTLWQAASNTVINLKTSPQFSEGVVTRVQSMYRDYAQTGPTQQELDNTLRQLRSSAALNSASNAQILARLVDINQYDLPLDLDFSIEQAQKLTVEQVKAALNRHLSAVQWTVVTEGPSVAQQPLPLPAPETSKGMCRAETGFVAS